MHRMCYNSSVLKNSLTTFSMTKAIIYTKIVQSSPWPSAKHEERFWPRCSFSSLTTAGTSYRPHSVFRVNMHYTFIVRPYIIPHPTLIFSLKDITIICCLHVISCELIKTVIILVFAVSHSASYEMC